MNLYIYFFLTFNYPFILLTKLNKSDLNIIKNLYRSISNLRIRKKIYKKKEKYNKS